MATTQHYLWASGHFLTVLASLRYFLAWMMFKPASPWWYKASFLGTLVSYAIVCQKQLGTPQPNIAYIRRAIMDESVQYFLLAFFWWSSKPIAITLLPFAIFSTFHALTFTRTNLMPRFLPPGPPATEGGPPTSNWIAKKLQMWVKANYDSAMKLVAYTELVILVRVVLGAIILQNSLLSPIVFAHFLRQRWFQSEFTREAVAKTGSRIETFILQQNNPTITSIWTKAKVFTGRWVGTLPANANVAGAAARN